MRPATGHWRHTSAARGAFSLIELLVVMGIIALLLSLLLPTFVTVRAGMKTLQCASNLRSIVLDFQFFAEGTSARGRGDSESLGGTRFYINDFQDSVYGVDEFWDRGPSSVGSLNVQNFPGLCPAGPTALTKRRGYPCGREALGPLDGVTFAVNMRLYRAVIRHRGRPQLAPQRSTQVPVSILNHPYVPLVMDVDASEAVARGLEPFYTAPPRSDSSDPYAEGRYWMPSERHRNRTNVAFVGGHVLASENPARESWNWDYQGQVGR